MRKRVVRAYEEKEGSCRALAKRFAIGFATVARWVRAYRQQGRLESKKPSGRPRILRHPEVVAALYAKQPSMSQKEAAQAYGKQTGQVVSKKTIGRTLARLGLSRKKRRYTPKSNIETRS